MTIRAHFDGKVIVPDEPADLPTHRPLLVHVESAPAEPHTAPSGSALEWMAQHALDDPSLPADLSENLDHYLYGLPKREP